MAIVAVGRNARSEVWSRNMQELESLKNEKDLGVAGEF
jgi:hypothetical protein